MYLQAVCVVYIGFSTIKILENIVTKLIFKKKNKKTKTVLFLPYCKYRQKPGGGTLRRQR